MSRKLLFIVGLALLVVAAALLIADANAPKPVSAQDECPAGAPCPTWIVDAWAASGHADPEGNAEAFHHWDEEDPKEVPPDCAKCHSETGYIDFLGADGSAAGTVDAPVAVGTTVTCTACHNPVTVTKVNVVFPSGADLEVGVAARCMECHQGRASVVQVNDAITAAGIGPDDVSADLRFINIHYFAAAASLYGSQAHGGYEYEGAAYQPKFAHVPEFDTCSECHSPHTLEVQVEVVRDLPYGCRQRRGSADGSHDGLAGRY